MKKEGITMTADVIIRLADSSVVFVKRKNDPDKGKWALPGGMMDGDEPIEETAVREAKEETNLSIRLDRVVGVYSNPDRDPRGRYISVTFIAYPVSGTLEAGSDAEDIMITKDFTGLTLAFDHNKILEDYLRILHHENTEK